MFVFHLWTQTLLCLYSSVPLVMNVVCYVWESDFYLHTLTCTYSHTHTDTLHNLSFLLCVSPLHGQCCILIAISHNLISKKWFRLCEPFGVITHSNGTCEWLYYAMADMQICGCNTHLTVLHGRRGLHFPAMPALKFAGMLSTNTCALAAC